MKFKVGSRVEVIDDTYQIIGEQIGDRGTVIYSEPYSNWATILFDEACGERGWDIEDATNFKEACQLGILDPSKQYRGRGKNLPREILKETQWQSIIWID